jgi:hypothetical protein
MIKRLIFIVIAIIILNTISTAYDTDNIHPKINENAITQSTVDNYLKIQLGFINGIKEVFKNKEIKEWIKEGGKLEDETNCRSRNHFHDPLKPWDNAGLNNAAVNTYCMLSGEKYSVSSSLIWAQNPFSDNLWSWTKARNYYYKALTSTIKDERDQNFAYTFRSLGQVMHLIADSSVPAHVRNDIHVFPLTIPGIGIEVGRQTYESWAKKNFSTLNYTAKKVDQSIFNQAVFHSSAPVPIAALWDQDKYNGTNPSITWTTNPSISDFGLTEYTNANFFSEDTIFKDYPHPSKENTNVKLIEQRAKDGKTDKVWYIQGYTSQRLAAYSYLWNYSNIIPKKGWLYNLDNYVYEDYASNLIPRAVGYSAGLLNYFFRGEIEMIPDDVSGSGYVIVNNTDENMSGILELWYDNKNDQRIRAWSSSLSINKKSSGNNKSTNIKLIPPSDTKEDSKYMLVFRGRLGSEEDAVVGRNIELKDEEYLFFLNTNYEMSTFKIGITNGQYQLTPKSKNININIDFDSFNLTIQSNPAKTEHYAAMPVSYQNLIAQYGLYRYGYTDWLGYSHFLSSGSPYCYRPKDFAEGSPYILGSESATAVTGYEDGIYASGRKNYTLDINGKMTSYWNSIWRKYIAGYVPQYYFKYKEKIGGEWIDGSILATNETPIAFIGKDKALLTTKAGDVTNLKLGNILLHATPADTDYANPAIPEGWNDYEHGCYYGTFEWYETGTPPGEVIYTGSGGYGYKVYTLPFHDYDNMGGDDTFISFFSEVSNERKVTYNEKIYNDSGFCYADYSNGSDNYYGTTKYYLSYRYNCSTVVKIELATLESIMENYLNPTLYPTLSGTRITGQSSQINDTNIVYTYIVERPEKVADKDKWVFDKRIVGIINISDNTLPIGHKQEFELDFSGMNFDPMLLSAIGVTR